MQVETERGIVNIKAEYQSVEDAKKDGYGYAFYSTKLGRDLYSKCLDDGGFRHSFATIDIKEMKNDKVISILEDIKNQWDNKESVEALKRGIEAVKHETPKRVKVQSWIDTKCPSCSSELSKHHGDGYYSIPKYYYVPLSNSRMGRLF